MTDVYVLDVWRVVVSFYFIGMLYSRLYDLVILVELGFGFRFDFKVRFWYFVESFCCLGVRKVFLRSRIVVL